MKLSKLNKAAMGIAGSALIALISVSCASAGADTNPNTNPRSGQVNVLDLNWIGKADVTKQCDGSTLIYVFAENSFYRGGMSVVPNSPECTKSG